MNFESLPPEYLKALGTITVAMSRMEHLMIVALQMICSVKSWNEMVCLVGGENFDALCKKLGKMGEVILHDEQELLQKCEEIVDSLDRLNVARNKYIHSMWWPLPTGLASRTKFLRTLKSGIKLDEQESVPIERLDELIKEIGRTENSLFMFGIDNYLKIQAAIKRRESEYKLAANAAARRAQ